MEAGLGMGCSAAWLWPLTTALAFSATQAQGQGCARNMASLDENVVALLGSAGHLCCQDRTLGQASCWSCQQLGIN